LLIEVRGDHPQAAASLTERCSSTVTSRSKSRSTVTMLSLTLESTNMTGRSACGPSLRRSFSTEQFHELFGAHARVRAATHPADQAPTAGRARIDAQRAAIFDDVHLIPPVEPMPLANRGGDRHLALAIEPHRAA